MAVIGFDVYGTLVDPAGITGPVVNKFGDRAEAAIRLWREKQLEFSFRRALMRTYVDFDVCTAQALQYVSDRLGVVLDAKDQNALLASYLELPSFPDVEGALRTLTAGGHSLCALTNGTERSVRILLQKAGISDCLPRILSADSARTFKPDPAVYELLSRLREVGDQQVWLVSANAFDVIGAKARGLRAAWVRRDPSAIFDPWEFSPDLVVQSLEDLSARLSAA